MLKYEDDFKKNSNSISLIKSDILPIIKNRKVAVSDIVKTIYSKETGDLLSNLKNLNFRIKQEINAESNFSKLESNKSSSLIKSNKLSSDNHLVQINPLKMEKLVKKNDTNQTGTLILNNSSTIHIFSESSFQHTNIKDESIIYQAGNHHRKKNSMPSNFSLVSDGVSIGLKDRETSSAKKLNLKTDKYSVDKTNSHQNNSNFSSYYCPHCAHCNINYAVDQNLDKILTDTKEAQNVIKRGIEFLIDNETGEGLSYFEEIFSDRKTIDRSKLVNSNNSSQNLSYSNNLIGLSPEKNINKFKIEEFLNHYTKHMNTRNTYFQTVCFLQALVDDKIDIEKFVGIYKLEKLNYSLLAQGKLFINNEIKDNIEFDKEIDSLFDENMKESVKKLFKSKFIQIANENNINLNNELLQDEVSKATKKFLILFVALMQMLSEIAIECKEKAILIFKIFKIYFVEIEKKWISLTTKLKDKIIYYKNLCQTILQQKNKSILKIENISDVLFANKLTKENLDDHKKLIQDLLQLINEKRDEMYLIQAQLNIANKELEYWIYDYQNIKINPKLRERMKDCNINQIIQNVNEEMTHKQISKEDKNMLVNADKFLLVSGQRNYFFDQKAYYQSEIDRLTKMYQKHYYKKRNFKKQVIDLKEELGKEKYRLENEIKFLREKLIWEKQDLSVQTDLDLNYINKMEKNHEIVIFQKRLSQNKLSHFVEKIKYNFSKQKPFSLKSMLNLIPEIYSEKIDDDNKCELEGRRKILMDDYFYRYITKKFKLSKIIKKNCEQTIMSIFKYSSEDSRVDLFRKFLGIGDDKIRREILDNYLIILKNLPISFFKLFEDDFKSYLMNTEMGFEIFHQKFQSYDMVFLNKDQIILNSLVSNSNNHQEGEFNSKENNPEIKLNTFLLNRFYNRSLVFVNSINTEFKSNLDAEVPYDKFYENFTLVNKEFEFLNDIHIFDIFKKNFNLYKNVEKQDYFIKSESFLNYFLKKSFFKIRIVDFLEISLNSLISIYGGLEKKIYKLYDDADFRNNGYILYKEFEEILISLFGNTENKWKFNELFKIAVGSQEKEFLSREEFIIYCLNNRELLNILLKAKKNNI